MAASAGAGTEPPATASGGGGSPSSDAASASAGGSPTSGGGGPAWTNVGSLPSTRDREIVDRRLAFKRMLTDGAVFRKYGRYGLPHNRLVFYNPDTRMLVWCAPGARNGEKEGMLVRDILEVVEGPESPIFKKNAGWWKRTDCCFSVITDKRSLDLEAGSPEEKEEWVKAFLCLKRYRAHI